MTEPVVAYRRKIHSHLIGVCLKFQWREGSYEGKRENLTGISRGVVWSVQNYQKNPFPGSPHIQVNIALSLWTHYGMICKLFLCFTYKCFLRQFQRDLSWCNIALVECGIRVLKVFTFFALGKGYTLQSSI